MPLPSVSLRSLHVRPALEKDRKLTPANNQQIRDDAINDYILKNQHSAWLARKDQHGVRLPLQFDSVDDELNILA